MEDLLSEQAAALPARPLIDRQTAAKNNRKAPLTIPAAIPAYNKFAAAQVAVVPAAASAEIALPSLAKSGLALPIAAVVTSET